MDVGFRSVSTVLILLFSLSACSEKTTTSVFDETAFGSSACRGQAKANHYIVQWEDGHFTVEKASSDEKFKKDFLEPNLEKIRRVEYDRLVKFERDVTPIQTSDVDPKDTWGQEMVEVSSVWSEGVLGQNVTVAVVDSPVDVTNPQLAPRIAYNTAEIPDNGIDDDNNGFIDDYAGFSFISQPTPNAEMSVHGTHVSGIIGADHSKGYIKGMAPQVKIIPAPFIDAETGGSIGDAIKAMQYAASRGAKIINASWGGAPCMLSLKNAFAELNDKGVLVVVAAGNDGRDLDVKPDYPAAFNMPNQITVAASTATDAMINWSNSSFNLVHLAAPGVEILSTITQNRIAFSNGTSMAAPFVTGTAALLWSDRPTATVGEIKTALLRSVDVDPNRQYKVQTLGRLNARKALLEIRKLVP